MARRSSRLRSPAKSTYASNLDSLDENDTPQTPTAASRLPKPAVEEMHPSKAQQSTTKKPDSGLRLGFTDIEAGGENQPSGIAQQSPSKIGISSFDFRFARPGPTLGPEAQRMMDELREEALRIKVKLAAEKEEQRCRGEEVTSRKIAQPKGKVGRYSDVHMEQFKKMDSIADHPSAFRAQLTPTATLKRKQSPTKPYESERLENTAPAKRARRTIHDDTSVVRPVSRDTPVKPMTPNIPRSQSNLLAAISTPTQSSLARAVSTKTPSTQIPTLSRSPSKPSLIGTPRTLPKPSSTNNFNILPKPESKSFLRSPGKFARVKSILRQASASMKKPISKPSSIPSLTRSPSKPNLDKVLPSVPTTPLQSASSRTVKHVNFTPETVKKNNLTSQYSPSPVKSGIPRSASRVILSAKSKIKLKEAQDPTAAGTPHVASRSPTVEYPSLAGVRPLPAQSTSPRKLPPSVPGAFTFRSDHTINFGASPSPSPKGFGSSPGQASVRQVRESIVPNMPGSFPGSNKENSAPLPSVPHGIVNKKRRRIDSDDETEEEHSPKKHKVEAAEGPMLVAPRLHATPKSRLTSPTKKGFLSISRLNMLSQPKTRK